MQDYKIISNFLKCIGIAALVAIPIYFIAKILDESKKDYLTYSDDNIFEAELE